MSRVQSRRRNNCPKKSAIQAAVAVEEMDIAQIDNFLKRDISPELKTSFGQFKAGIGKAPGCIQPPTQGRWRQGRKRRRISGLRKRMPLKFLL
jgi:hypothetical protein